MVNINNVSQGKILYEVSNFEVVAKEVLRVESDHIHFKYSMKVSKRHGLDIMFHTEKEAVEYLKERLLKKLQALKG